jgi:hypothetical protein
VVGGLSFAACAFVLIGLVAVLLFPRGGSDAGSPELAAEWRAELLAAAGPDAAAAADSAVQVVRCRDGGWVFGKSRNSHLAFTRGRGTVVVRDSAGRVRAFFGHVCGPEFLGGRSPATVDDFYDWLLGTGFTEYQFPDVARPGAAADRTGVG